MSHRTILRHDSLIREMKEFGYRSNSEGVCFGVAHMGKQAILSEDIDSFNHHIQTLIEAKKTKTVNSDQRVEISAFFDGIELYFQSNRYPSLYEEDDRPKHQDTLSAAQYVSSEALEAKGGSVKLSSFSGYYTPKDLVDYLRTLRESIDQYKCTSSVALVLNNCIHAITIGFDPKKQKWIFVDANDLPIKTNIDSDEILANKILKAFSANDHVVFNSKLYITGNSKDHYHLVVNDWQKKTVWVDMHKINKTKAMLNERNLPSLLHVAILQEDAELVEEILKAGASPNHGYSTQQITPLYLAANVGNAAIVKKLLEYKANPNQKIESGSIPFDLAYEKNYKTTINVLLSAKDGIVLVNGRSILHKAVEMDDMDLLKLALKHKHNINFVDSENETPLYVATSNNNMRMIKFLLLNGADSDVGTGPSAIASLNGREDILSLLKNANEYRLMMNEIQSLSEKSSPIRKTAISNLQFSAKEVNDFEKLKNMYRRFKMVDHVCQHLLHIKENYHSNNPRRIKDMSELNAAIQQAYQTAKNCQLDEEMEHCVLELKKTALAISEKAQADHSAHASCFSARRCGLSTKIQAALKTLNSAPEEKTNLKLR